MSTSVCQISRWLEASCAADTLLDPIPYTLPAGVSLLSPTAAVCPVPRYPGLAHRPLKGLRLTVLGVPACIQQWQVILEAAGAETVHVSELVGLKTSRRRSKAQSLGTISINEDLERLGEGEGAHYVLAMDPVPPELLKVSRRRLRFVL